MRAAADALNFGGNLLPAWLQETLLVSGAASLCLRLARTINPCADDQTRLGLATRLLFVRMRP